MKYINDLNIKRFRGIKDLELKDLGEVNILVGQNNSGKTSVLEAISLMEHPTQLLENIIRVGTKREILLANSSPYTVFTNMLNFHSKNMFITADINGTEFKCSIDGERVELLTGDAKGIEGFNGSLVINYGKFSVEKEGILVRQQENYFIRDIDLKIIPIEYISPGEHLIKNSPNEAIKRGKKKDLIQALSILDQDIIGLETVIEDGKITILVENKKLGLIPLSTYGDGVKKVLLLGSSIIKAENGVLLIDEVETAIHNEALVDVFKWFIKACKEYKVQVFMTTHSLEVIDAILESQKDLDNEEFLRDSLRVITIKNSTDSEKTRVRNIDGLRAYEARENYDLELRG